jgi:hypothetical protein
MQELNKAIDDIWSKGELSNGITTRYAVPEDAKRLLEIYAPYVENTAITFEYDLGWVENAICMRNAGVPIEALIEYVKLYQEGDETFEARRQLLQEQLDALKEQHAQIEATMKRLKYKISRYENAVKTGVLSWDNCPEDININHS